MKCPKCLHEMENATGIDWYFLHCGCLMKEYGK